MPITPDSTPEMVKYHKNIFFLLNTCGRMCGEFIEEVNDAMHEVIPELKKIAESYPEQSINFCRMDYDRSAKWVCDGGIDILDFYWCDARTDWGTALGEAYYRLNSALSRREGGFMHAFNNTIPIIILLLGATPTDDVERGLNVLKNNKWFQISIKIAIEVEHFTPSCFHQYLLDFTMDKDAIIHADETNLRKILKDIMTRSVMSAHEWVPPYNQEKYVLSNIIGKPQIYTDFIKHEEPNGNESTDDLWDVFDL